MPDTSYHILIPYPYPQHVMPYYVLSYRIKPYIDILSRNTHNRYINTYIQIIGILAQLTLMNGVALPLPQNVPST